MTFLSPMNTIAQCEHRQSGPRKMTRCSWYLSFLFAPTRRNHSFFKEHASNMGFENVWFSRKGPKPSADGVKGKVISGRGTRECR